MNQNQNNPDFLHNKAGGDDASFEDFLHTVNAVDINEVDLRQSAPGKTQPGAPTPGYPAPGMPQMPDLPPMPDLGDDMSDVEGIPPMPDLSTMPGMPGMPDFSGMPGAPGMPEPPSLHDLPETPDFPDMPGAPTLPGMPSAMPGAAGLPGLPETPDFSGVAPAPGMPEMPATPDFPDMPAMPDDMGMSGMSGLSALPDNMSFDTEEPDDLPESVLAQMGVEAPAASPEDQAVADVAGLELAGIDHDTDVDLGAEDDQAAQMLELDTGLSDLSYAGVSYDNLGAEGTEATDQEWPEIPAVQTAEVALPRGLAAAVQAAEDEAAGKHPEPAKEKEAAPEPRYKVNRKASKKNERFALDFGTTPDIDKKFRQTRVVSKESAGKDQDEDFFEDSSKEVTSKGPAPEPSPELEDKADEGVKDTETLTSLEDQETAVDTSSEEIQEPETLKTEDSETKETETIEEETEVDNTEADLADEEETEGLEEAQEEGEEPTTEEESSETSYQEEEEAETEPEEGLEIEEEELTAETSEEPTEEAEEAAEESTESEEAEEIEEAEEVESSEEAEEAQEESFAEASEAEASEDEAAETEVTETEEEEESDSESEETAEAESEEEVKAEEQEEDFEDVNFDELQGDMLTDAVGGITLEEEDAESTLVAPSPKDEKAREDAFLPSLPDFLAGDDVLTGDEADAASAQEAAKASDHKETLFADEETPWASDKATKAASTEFIPEMPEGFDLEDGLFAGTIDKVANKPEGEPKTSVFDPLAFTPEAGLPSSLPEEMGQGELGTLANLEALADSANEGEQLTRPSDLPEGESTGFSDEDLAAAMGRYLDGAEMPKELGVPDMDFTMPHLSEGEEGKSSEEGEAKAEGEEDFDLSPFTEDRLEGGAYHGTDYDDTPKVKITLTPEEKAEEERKALEHDYEESAQSLHQSLSSPESATYARLGVSTAKKAIKKALRNTDKGIFPGAFAIIQEDIAGDPDYCYAMHADGAGNKSSLSYLQYKNTGNIKAFRGVAEDATVMNLDDLMCVGATGPFYLSNTISRNAQRIPSAAVGEIIDSYLSFFEKMSKYGVEIKSCGGETADMGDTIMTLAIDAIASVRMKREDVIDCSRIKPGLVIVGFSSSGQTIYEDKPNSGIGSNGLTAAKHALLNKSYAQLYPETYSVGDNYDDVYTGNFTMSSPLPGTSTTIGEAILSPTRTYAPVLAKIFEEHRKDIYGIVHLTGGGLCKPLSFSKGIKYINDNLFRRPPIFEQIALTQKFLEQEMYKIFNLGQRLEIFVEEDVAPKIIEIAESFKLDAQVIGRTEANEDPETNQLLIKDLGCEYYFFSNN